MKASNIHRWNENGNEQLTYYLPSACRASSGIFYCQDGDWSTHHGPTTRRFVLAPFLLAYPKEIKYVYYYWLIRKRYNYAIHNAITGKNYSSLVSIVEWWLATRYCRREVPHFVALLLGLVVIAFSPQHSTRPATFIHDINKNNIESQRKGNAFGFSPPV